MLIYQNLILIMLLKWIILFSGCSSLINIDLSNFNNNNVTSMVRMFFGCTSLTNIDLSNFNTNNVTCMGVCFGDVLL